MTAKQYIVIRVADRLLLLVALIVFLRVMAYRDLQYLSREVKKINTDLSQVE